MTNRMRWILLALLFGMAITFSAIMAHYWPHKDCVQMGEYSCE